MAMVFKSERNLDYIKENEFTDMGPGRYFQNFSRVKKERNKKPFLSGSVRNLTKVKDTPGPGAYYQDETLIKYLRNIQNEKISLQNDKVQLLSKDSGSSYQLHTKADKKGFNVKSKRFKIKPADNLPGPGQYFVEKKHNNKEKMKKLKEIELYSKQKLQFLKNCEYQRIPTIPSKENRFGFDLGKNGNLIKKINPEIYKSFSGEKGDTVGPGSYEIENPNNWLKTGTTWSKLKTIRDCNKTNSSITTTNNSEHQKKGNYKLGEENGIINIQISPLKEKNKDNDTLKQNIFNCRIQKCKNLNKKKILIEQNFENVIKTATPGPGYYFNPTKNTSFYRKPVPEYQQFFGTKIQRFKNLSSSMDNNNLGPGEYFKSNKKNNNTSGSAVFTPFLTTADRFYGSFVPEELKNNPGPGDYDIGGEKNKKSKSNSQDKKFGSTTMRFDGVLESKWRNNVPGPGYYHPEIAEISQGNNQNRNLKTFSEGQLYTTNKKDCEIYKRNSVNFKEHERSPPVGLYNPDIVYSIDYNNKKKLSDINNENVAFTSTVDKENKKIVNLLIENKNSNLGPGLYYKEKKVKNTQIYPPFHQSDSRKDWVPSYNQKLGPGRYNTDNYNEWNKKSFNINYV